jgi:hypothetical protein
MAKKKKRPGQRPAAMRWEFGPDVPTHDFLEDTDLEDPWGLQQAVESFLWWLEEGHFLTWEAVVCHEQGLPLTAEQEEALGGLISFGDEEDDQIHCIDEMERPSETWYVILNKIAPHLLTEPFDTSETQEEVKSDGWEQITTALREHGQGLSLPAGATSVMDVVLAELRHKLWLQCCFNDLAGLGQEEDMTLQDPEEHYRSDEFIDHLRQCRESVAYLGLTLKSLLTRVILPEGDRPIFVQLVQDKLGLGSSQERIADHL